MLFFKFGKKQGGGGGGEGEGGKGGEGGVAGAGEGSVPTVVQQDDDSNRGVEAATDDEERGDKGAVEYTLIQKMGTMKQMKTRERRALPVVVFFGRCLCSLFSLRSDARCVCCAALCGYCSWYCCRLFDFGARARARISLQLT